MLTLERKHGITLRSSKVLRGSAAAAVLLSTLVVGCGGAGSPTTPTPNTPTPATPTPPAPTPPPTSSGLVVPGFYNMDTVRTCLDGGGCGTRAVPTGLFIFSSTGVIRQQLRGHIQFGADGTFYYESVQRTDSPLGNTRNRSSPARGTFNVAGALVSFKVTPGATEGESLAPGTVTIDTDGSLLRFYDIPIEPPFVSKAVTVNVTETYRLVPLSVHGAGRVPARQVTRIATQFALLTSLESVADDDKCGPVERVARPRAAKQRDRRLLQGASGREPRRPLALPIRWRWKPSMRSDVVAESTDHWLTTAVEAPATKSDQVRPMTPSPRAIRPRAVSQPESTTSRAPSRRRAISHACNSPSSPGMAGDGARTTREYIGLASSRMP